MTSGAKQEHLAFAGATQLASVSSEKLRLSRAPSLEQALCCTRALHLSTHTPHRPPPFLRLRLSRPYTWRLVHCVRSPLLAPAAAQQSLLILPAAHRRQQQAPDLSLTALDLACRPSASPHSPRSPKAVRAVTTAPPHSPLRPFPSQHTHWDQAFFSSALHSPQRERSCVRVLAAYRPELRQLPSTHRSLATPLSEPETRIASDSSPPAVRSLTRRHVGCHHERRRCRQQVQPQHPSRCIQAAVEEHLLRQISRRFAQAKRQPCRWPEQVRFPQLHLVSTRAPPMSSHIQPAHPRASTFTLLFVPQAFYLFFQLSAYIISSIPDLC